MRKITIDLDHLIKRFTEGGEHAMFSSVTVGALILESMVIDNESNLSEQPTEVNSLKSKIKDINEILDGHNTMILKLEKYLLRMWESNQTLPFRS